MTWNYRLVRKVVGQEVVYGIHEAYYGLNDEDPKAICITENPVSVKTCFPLDEEDAKAMKKDLKDTLKRMLRALDAPMLDADNLRE